MKRCPCVPTSVRLYPDDSSEQNHRSHPDVPNCYEPGTSGSEAPPLASGPELM